MPRPQPPFHPDPELATNPDYRTVTVDVARVLVSFSGSLVAYEWFKQGRPKTTTELSPDQQAERDQILRLYDSGVSLPMPVLGWGIFDGVEIGGHRAVFMALASRGISHLPVMIPQSQEKFLKSFIVPDATATRERGNVLVYILIAIVLIAALTYAVSSTGRHTGTSVVSDGQAKALAAEILNYSNQVKGAVDRLSLRGCTPTQLNADNSVETGYGNAGAPTDDTCDIFAPQGGAITWATPGDGMNDGTPWFISGRTTVHNDAGFASGNSAAEADLVLLLFGLPENLCQAINTRLGVASIPVNDGAFTDTTKFQGAFAYAEDINGLPATSQPSPCTAPATSPHFCGKPAGCFREESGGQRYVFYQVLVQR